MLSTMQPARASVVNRIFTPRSAFQNVGRGSLSRSPSCQRAVLLSISQGGGSRFNFRARDYTARRTCGIMHAVSEKCFVTTPVYYVNDKPHIGHVYTSTVADVYARFQRNMGKDVYFLTGTDEHGLKVEQSAEKRGVTTQQLADENSALFREVMEDCGIEGTSFHEVRGLSSTLYTKAGYTTEQIRELMAHEHVSTTLGYQDADALPYEAITMKLER